MKYLVTALFTAAALGLAVGTAPAQPQNPSVALHVGPIGPDLDAACSTAPATCAEMATVGPTVPAGGGPAYWVYLVAVPNRIGEDTLDGVKGLSMGIWYEFNYLGGEYTGAYVGTFKLCADQDFPGPNWPQPWSGNTITWVQCLPEPTEFRIAGVMPVSLYSAALMQVTKNPNQQFAVAGCDGGQVNIAFPEDAGWVSFGGRSSGGDATGCNPCLEPCASVANEPQTWGKLKRTFGGE